MPTKLQMLKFNIKKFEDLKSKYDINVIEEDIDNYIFYFGEFTDKVYTFCKKFGGLKLEGEKKWDTKIITKLKTDFNNKIPVSTTIAFNKAPKNKPKTDDDYEFRKAKSAYYYLWIDSIGIDDPKIPISMTHRQFLYDIVNNIKPNILTNKQISYLFNIRNELEFTLKLMNKR